MEKRDVNNKKSIESEVKMEEIHRKQSTEVKRSAGRNRPHLYWQGKSRGQAPASKRMSAGWPRETP